MKQKYMPVLIAALLIAMLLSALPAQAASRKVYVIDNNLPVYSSTSGLGNALGVMTYGESMTLVAFQGNWAKVKNSDGDIGYCKLDALQVADPNTLNVKLATRAVTPVYERPDDDSKIIHTCKKGSRVTVVAQTEDGEWYRVKDGSRYGYIECDLLNKIVWVNEDSTCSLLTQYGGVSGVVSFGQAYELIGTQKVEYAVGSSTIAKIRNNKGQYAYISYSALTDENPNTINKTMYTQISGKLLRTQIATKYGTKSIAKNEAVTLLGITPNGQTAYIKYGSKYYYINALYLHEEKAPSSGRTIYVCEDEDDLELHKKGTFNSPIVTKVDGGEAVTLVGSSANGLHPQVKTSDGKIGYNVCGFFEAEWQR